MAMAYREWQEAFDEGATSTAPAEATAPRRSKGVATALRAGAQATARRLHVEPPTVRDTEDDSAQREQQARLEAIEQFQTQRAQLVNRLDDGARRIEEARAEGKDVNTWEEHWIRLLHRYEMVCDRIRELQADL